MKRLIYISLLFTLISSVFYHAKAQSVHELSDIKDVVFARNLKDWQLKPVDSLLFDVYYPTGALSNRKYPVFLSLHGGSFVTASKESVNSFADDFAELGYIVVAPDYRLGYANSGSGDTCSSGDDSTGLQGAIYRAEQDINACLRYITNHAAAYNIDTSRIFIGGASAGGTLALNVAYVTDSLAAIYYPDFVSTLGTLQNSGNSEPFNYTLKGLAPMWGVMPYWEGAINNKSAIPTILFKGANDVNIPNGTGYYLDCSHNSRVRAGKGVYDVMTALGVPCVFHYQLYSGHAAYDNDFCIRTINCFFSAIMNKQPYSGYFETYDTSCR